MSKFIHVGCEDISDVNDAGGALSVSVAAARLTRLDVVVSVRPVENRQLHQLHLLQVVFTLRLREHKRGERQCRGGEVKRG